MKKTKKNSIAWDELQNQLNIRKDYVEEDVRNYNGLAVKRQVAEYKTVMNDKTDDGKKQPYNLSQKQLLFVSEIMDIRDVKKSDSRIQIITKIFEEESIWQHSNRDKTEGDAIQAFKIALNNKQDPVDNKFWDQLISTPRAREILTRSM